jgi:hypothetical protein
MSPRLPAVDPARLAQCGWGEVPPGGPEQGLFICLPAETMELKG